MLIFNVDLDGIEKLLHRIVENTEICPPPNYVFIDDLDLIIKLFSTFMEIVKKMLVLIVFITSFLATSKNLYMILSHCLAILLFFSHFIPYLLMVYLIRSMSNLHTLQTLCFSSDRTPSSSSIMFILASPQT